MFIGPVVTVAVAMLLGETGAANVAPKSPAPFRTTKIENGIAHVPAHARFVWFKYHI